jgi:hypothetical protein
MRSLVHGSITNRKPRAGSSSAQGTDVDATVDNARSVMLSMHLTHLLELAAMKSGGGPCTAAAPNFDRSSSETGHYHIHRVIILRAGMVRHEVSQRDFERGYASNCSAVQDHTNRHVSGPNAISLHSVTCCMGRNIAYSCHSIAMPS